MSLDTISLLNTSNQACRLKLEVNSDEFVSQSKIDEAMSVIDSLDFKPISFKLEKEYGWSRESLDRAVPLYKQWLVLQLYYSELSFAPSELVDEYWHMHILDTRKYIEDCQFVFGYYLHHYPYFGLTEVENAETLKKGFDLTKRLYQHHFGHSSLGMGDYKTASCGCRSGNGGSCR